MTSVEFEPLWEARVDAVAHIFHRHIAGQPEADQDAFRKRFAQNISLMLHPGLLTDARQASFDDTVQLLETMNMSDQEALELRNFEE